MILFPTKSSCFFQKQLTILKINAIFVNININRKCIFLTDLYNKRIQKYQIFKYHNSFFHKIYK